MLSNAQRFDLLPLCLLVFMPELEWHSSGGGG